MDFSHGRMRALLSGASVFVLMAIGASAAQAQQSQTLDAITIVATKTEERAIDALAPVSVVGKEQIQWINPSRLREIFYNVPGVSFTDRGDSPESSINIRGLQDFGRVAVVVDGARQNYQRTGHNANGSFFLEPELLAGADIVRGPTANIYGSGAIGGVASFRTKDIDDVVRPGERWGTDVAGMLGSNEGRAMASAFTGVRVNPNVDVFLGATHRTEKNYKDGEGIEISNSGNNVSTGLAKLTVRPLDGHEIKFGGIFQENLYNNGQYRRSAFANQAGTSVYASEVKNYTANARWRYERPEDNLFNWDGNIYWNRTDNAQTKIAHISGTAQAGVCTTPGNNISGCLGDPRGYVLDTFGFDIHNTSRINVGDWRNAVTFGVDGFKDDVDTTDVKGNSNITTPGGIRTVSGGFAQWKANYSTWLEIVSAIRFDQYELESTNVTASGDRWSPKITVGITPFRGFTPYVSYAEGYRAPAITETIISGAHATGSGFPGIITCADGTTGFFCFLPNPNLRPEVGKTKEAGLNMKYDSVFTAGDSFRGKFNVFHNDLEDFIDLKFFGTPTVVGGNQLYPLAQYQNVPKAHIEGFEGELMYDAGAWFVGVSGQIQRGLNELTQQGLVNIQNDKIVTTGGVRLLDRTMTIAASWVSAAANTHVDQSVYLPSTGYDLLNFYLSWQPHKDMAFNFGIDNILDKYYRPYAVPKSSSGDASGTQNDVLWASASPGTVYKASLRVHFGAM